MNRKIFSKFLKDFFNTFNFFIQCNKLYKNKIEILNTFSTISIGEYLHTLFTICFQNFYIINIVKFEFLIT